MALSIARPKHRFLANPSLFHLFSTSSSNDQNDVDNNDAPQSESPSESVSSFSSYFSDVKASLRNRQQHMGNQTQNQNFRRPPPPPPQQQSSILNRPSKIASLEEIKKNLSEYRRRSSVPHPTDPDNASSHSGREQPISFQELYKRNLIAKSEDAARGTGFELPKPSGKLSFEVISQSLRKMQPNREANIERRGRDPISLDALKNSLRFKPNNIPPGSSESTVIGGTGGLPFTVFGKEMKDEDKDNEATRTEFVKMYGHDELGEKLRSLRPENGVKEFSLHELSERVVKLREIEEKESAKRAAGFSFKELRESLHKLKMTDDEKARRTSTQRLDILGTLGRTPDFMLQPPKEHLVEKYFHPDNMSSAEKMKIELAKVRDEFKMSESDCGSSRVQVAQLTIKIKHLSSVLHKKDKHSRKGLVEMVQKRKSILKYLRRTDWDSYCLVLDKLGLRDNTGFKKLARPQ